MKINGLNGANALGSGTNNMVQVNDSVSKNIQNQITNAQKQLKELSANKDMNIEEKIKDLISDSVNELGITVKEVKYENEKGVNYLRIFIDKEPFINIDDCVNVTNLVNPILDEADLIADNYILDVCSKEKGCE